MAESGLGARWLVHFLTAVIAAAVILLPTFNRRAAQPATESRPPEGTQARVAPSAPGPPGGLRAGAIQTLGAVVDAAARKLMPEQHAPGTAVAIVHDGRVIALRAYGMARVETSTPVDPAGTLFRVGSVTKPLTAAAVLTLVDEGRLDLFRDVREYLPGLSLPWSVTAHQLLTHTAGFDEKFAGNFTRAPGDLAPLPDYLRRSLRAFTRPGRSYSYASANYAVAGWLLEQLSGMPYAGAMEARLFSPLGMTATTARQPPGDRLVARVARGYAWDGAAFRPLPFRYTNTSPAGAVSTTAADMSRFMLAVLGDLHGPPRALSPASRAAVLRPQFRDHPRLPGVTYGFHEWRTRGRVLLHHDGTLDDHVGVLVLDPDNRFGMFAASNSNPGIGNHLLEPVLTHLYGPEPAPPAPVALRGTGHAAQVAGVYLDLDRTRHDLSSVRALMPMLQARIAADGDAITWAGRRWVEVEPFVFRAADSTEPLVFRSDGTMQTWNATYERIGWREQTPAQLGLAVACVLVFVVCASRARRMWRDEAPAARACALFVAVANVAFVVWFGASLRRLGETTPLPAIDVAFLTLGVAAAAVAVLLPGFAVAAWRAGWWTRGGRAAYTTLTVSAIAFAAWLNAWNLLGFQY
jgi:CubicO group peptidase (beta-lactamase class C family)